jgi:NAD(P)-dependent dehydrogenase (short-subunit alcohol dehydrogenase family)
MVPEPFIDFGSKFIMVTGASSGIGRAIAVELAKRNARLILLGRNQAELKKTAHAAQRPDTVIINLDLNDLDTIEPTIKDVSRKSGRIYGLCNAAGVVETRPLSSAKYQNIQSILNINLVAGIELARIISRRDVIDADGGSFLFISSIYGIVGVPGEVGYCATKGGVAAAARAMAVELAKKNIRVNILSPGFVMTEMTEKALSILTEDQAKSIKEKHLLGTGSPEDVAKSAAFLLAPQTRWITGTELIIDGGYTVQ